MIAKGGFVYILTNKHHTTLYTGRTSDIQVRTIQHRDKFYPKSFSARYNVNKLVYYRFFESVMTAIEEEKRIKGGSRQQKVNLIDSINPDWNDLWEEINDW